MTALRQEANAIIDTIPEEYMEKFLEVVKNFKNSFVTPSREEARKKEIFARLDELFAKEKPMTEEQKRRGRERAAKFMESCRKIDEIIGGEIPWASEEEMIEEIRQDRRERWKNAHYA